MKMRHEIRRLLIVSHVVHFRHQQRLHAYAPYAREIDIWADLFPEVLIAAPCRDQAPDADCAEFTRPNIGVVPQKETRGGSWQSQIHQLLSVPASMWRLASAMRRADAIQVRCPGNLGLLGAVLAPLYSRFLVAKYTGQWNGFPGEARTWKLQRWLLNSRWFHGPVAIYGAWPGQSPKIVSLFTSVMTDEQMRLARECAARRTFRSPVTVLFVGRLSEAKNVHILLQAIGQLKSRGVRVQGRIVGQGPERPHLEQLCAQLDLGDQIRFEGGLEFDRVLQCYQESDVLVLASQTESWGKSLTEAMAFGMLCIASDRGLMPQMLADGRGFVVPPRDVEALTSVLARIAADPAALQPMSQRAAAWGQRYSLEGLRDAFRTMLNEHWHGRECAAPPSSTTSSIGVGTL